MTRILVGAVAWAVLAVPGVRAQGIDLVGMLDAYHQGRYDQAVATAVALPDLGPFRLRFVQDVPRWVNADPAHVEARSAAAAAFLLELTAARLESDWGRLSDLIEYTCVQLRATGPPTPFERAWHAASHALAGRARARQWLLGAYPRLAHQKPFTGPADPKEPPPPAHLLHALERFPDDPQFQLSRVVAWTWGRDAEPIRNVRIRQDNDDGRYRPRQRPQMEALVSLEPLKTVPEVAAEALVRAGLVHMTVDAFDAALAAFQGAQPIASEPSMQYLAHFNAGRALEGLRRPDDAAREYRRALELLPDAESASIALTSLQFIADDRDAAVAQIDRVFNRVTSATDPGRLTGYGSYLRWPALKAALRAAVSSYPPGPK